MNIRGPQLKRKCNRGDGTRRDIASLILYGREIRIVQPVPVNKIGGTKGGI
jgi:hypothetical protein